MEKQTKDVDLGGGWSATLVRPRFSTWLAWREVATPNSQGALVEEKGKDEEPAQGEAAAGLPTEAYAFLEEKLLPECVAQVRGPAGECGGGEFHFPDLGFARLGDLTAALLNFVLEADAEANFRPE